MSHRFMLLIALALAPAVCAGQLDREIAGLTPDQDVHVLITGHARGLTAGEVSAALARERVAEGNERSVVRRLEARRSLAGVLAALAARGARDVELLWTANAVTAVVSARLATELAGRPDVREVVADRQAVWIRPIRPTGLVAGHVWGPSKVGAPAVWQTGSLGQGVTIGIIDTGVDGRHPDLAGKVIRFRNFTKLTAPEEPPFDDEGHGTHCAGIMAGGEASGKPIGIAPKMRIIAAKGLNKNGAGGFIGLIRALNWMADPDGSAATKDQPLAVSCSWGANLNLPVISRVFWLSISGLRDAGVLPIVASGNEGKDKLSVPGSYPHSFAVGATEESDAVADFTSRGKVKWGSTTYIKPNISAPGDFIYSSVPNNKYEYMSGTSMATPAVAGIAALLKSANKNLSARQIEALLIRTAKDLGAPGEDVDFGRGLVDARAAALAATGGMMAEQSGDSISGAAPELTPTSLLESLAPAWERPASE